MNTLKEILGLPGVKESFGKTVREDSPLSISTDSRTIHSGQSFLALEGAKFKPMKFLEQLEQAPVVFYEKNPFNDKLARQARDKHFFVAVNDSVRFLQDIGSLAAKSFVSNGGKLIAIAGSNGKTTTKEMLFHLLKSFEPETVCTKKNNNNHIGVPLTLLQIESKTKFCVLELGSNHPEEIRFLCEISCPNIGVVTNIGDTHLEFFGSREEVFKEEGSLYEAIDNSSWASKLFFLNTDDQFLSQLPKKKHVIAYGKDDGNDIQVNASFDHALLRLEQGFEKTELCLLNDNITGEHNFINLSVAFIMARRLLKRTSKDLLAKAQSFVPTSNRSEWIELK
ncbi:MAG: Mur ligase family protein, partial [Bacteriovoracaceae bacterium]